MNHIHYLLLTGAFLMCSIHHGSAQSLLISTDTVFQESCEEFPPPFEVVYVVNNTDEQIRLRWNRTDYYYPYEGSFFLIIHGLQYPPNYYQGQVTVYARDTAEILFHIFTDIMDPGDTAFLQIRVYDDNDSLNTERTLTAIKYCPLQTNNKEVASEISFEVYPNPVVDIAKILLPEYLTVSSLDVYTVSGQLVRRIPVHNSEVTFSREGLPGGFYLLSLMQDGKVAGIHKMIVME